VRGRWTFPKDDPLWWRLRQEEPDAAMQGGLPWRAFIAKCERQLGLPWSVIREEFDRIPAVWGDQ
jgi:hypothetical protein